MTSTSLAAVLIAAATMTAPGPARYRLPRRGPRTVGNWWIGTSAVVLCAATAAAVMPPRLTLVALIGVAVLVRWQRRRRRVACRHIEGQGLASALEVLIGELSVGAHPLQAFTIAAGESAGSVGESLRGVAARARLGADVVGGFRSAASQSAVPAYWMRLAVFWELAVKHGLPMSVLMRAAHRDVLDRQRFSAKMQAALAGARATAVILAGLPGLGVLLGQLIGAHPLPFLLGGGVGGAFLVAGVGLIAVGLIWADRIIDRLLT